MNDVRRRDGSRELESVQVVADILEESFTPSKQHGDEIDLHLIDEARRPSSRMDGPKPPSGR